MKAGRSSSFGATSWGNGKGGGRDSSRGPAGAEKGARESSKGTPAPQKTNVANGNLKVTSKYPNDVTYKTLTGTYEEKGQNHGRKVYKKTERIPKHPEVNVFLYYWDGRDGADFSGWWFGDKIGGQQVWARAGIHGFTPPKTGWCIPWDSKTSDPGAIVVEPAGNAPQVAPSTKPRSSSEGASTPAGPSAAAIAQRVRKATDQITSVETSTNSMLQAAKKVTENTAATEQMLNVHLKKLQDQQKKLSEVQTSLTTDISEVRKGGASATASVTELSKLTPKIRTLQNTLNQDLGKLKSQIATVATQEKQKIQSEKDAREFKLALPNAKLEVTKTELEVDKVVREATPLLEKPPEGDSLNKQLQSVETAAELAQKKVLESRTNINDKLNAARKYTGETKTEALKELNSLQTKLSEVQKKLNVYKSFKKEFHNCVAARKALAEVRETLSTIPAEIAKASDMCKTADSGHVSDEEIKAVDAVLTPVKTSLSKTLATIEQKSRSADAATQSELASLRTKCQEHQKQIHELGGKLVKSRQANSVQQWLAMGREQVDKLDALVAACAEAEMPFLKGIEVLPKEESDPALAASDAACAAAMQAVNAAKNFLRGKLMEAKKLPKELAQSVNDQIAPLLERTEPADKKIIQFRKDTAERRADALVAGAADSIVLAETKITAIADVAKVLAVDKLDGTPIAELEESIKSITAMEKDALSCLYEAKRHVKEKRMGKGADASAAWGKIDNRVRAAEASVQKTKQAVQAGNGYVKATQAFEKGSEKLTKGEADVEKVASLVPDDASATITEENVKVVDEAISTASAALKEIQGIIQPVVGMAQSKQLKDKLNGLLERKTKASEKLDKAKAASKTPREKALAQVYMKEADAAVDAVEAALAATSTAELPFLKGLEVLPLTESQDAVTASETASADTREKIIKARQYINGKQKECQTFGAAEGNPVKEKFTRLLQRVTTAATSLDNFNKETASRKKVAKVHEAGLRVTEIEAESKKVIAAAEPFSTEESKDFNEEQAAGPLNIFLEAEKVLVTKMTEVRTMLTQLQKDGKSTVEQQATMKKLQTTLSDINVDVAKAKKPICVHEDRHKSKRVVAEATEKVGTLQAALETATKACAPLLEQEGEQYLVSCSIQVLAKALTEHAIAKTLDQKALLKEGFGTKKKMKEVDFNKYVRGLSASIGHEEVNFTEERCSAMFKHLDTASKGALTDTDFLGIFKQEGIVRKELSVTDGFSIEESKTLAKTQLRDVVEVFGIPKEDANKAVRSECKLVKDGTLCWITLRQGDAVYVQVSAPFKHFSDPLESALQTYDTTLKSASTFLEAKVRETGNANAGPLKDAREEIRKLNPQVHAAFAQLKSLREKVRVANDTLKKKEVAEKRAHIDAKEIAEALVIYGDAVGKAEDVEKSGKEMETTADQLLKLTADEEIEAFEKPATLQESVKKLAEQSTEKAAAAMVTINEKLEEAKKVTPSTGASRRATTELQKLKVQVEKVSKAAKAVPEKVATKLKRLIKVRQEKVQEALRASCHASKETEEKLFEKLQKDGKISAESFCKKVMSLPDLGIKEEHALLMCQKIEEGGISQRKFLSFLQTYYKVVKEIAITDGPDVNTCKTLRKLDRDEVVVAVGAVTNDEKIGVARVQVKILLDGQSGWVTIKGNQGTPFLQPVSKPYFICSGKDATMDNDVKIESGAVRELQLNEELEMLEGPQKIVLPSESKAFVQAMKDDAKGWMVLKDKHGITFGEPNSKLWICKSAVAITDTENITESKVLRKLAVDEKFEATSAEVTDATGVFRIKAKAAKDDVEGWITTKGNAGTIFATLIPNSYVVVKEADLHKRALPDGGDVIRKLAAGEAFKIVNAPKEEKSAPEERIKVRAVSDKKVGWVSKSKLKRC